MSEGAVIDKTTEPSTRDSLARDLAKLGLARGEVVLVHSSLSRLGWVVGGAQAVVLALADATGSRATLVMPTHTSLSEPSGWRNPPVPEAWWELIRQETPAYDPVLTPTQRMGAIVDCFRYLDGVVRSSHPAASFAARGPAATTVVGDHQLGSALGERSPLARIYDLDGWVLLLGVGHEKNTSLHLAEHRADFPAKRWITEGVPVMVDGNRRWVKYQELDVSGDDFSQLGSDFASTGRERRGPVGAGTGLLMRQRDLVDFALGWIESHRLELEMKPK